MRFPCLKVLSRVERELACDLTVCYVSYLFVATVTTLYKKYCKQHVTEIESEKKIHCVIITARFKQRDRT